MTLPKSGIVSPAQRYYLLGHEDTIRQRLHVDGAAPRPGGEHQARGIESD